MMIEFLFNTLYVTYIIQTIAFLGVSTCSTLRECCSRSYLSCTISRAMALAYVCIVFSGRNTVHLE